MDDFYTIISTDGLLKGKAIEDEDTFCNMEGCNGTQYNVEWEDGSRTIICGRGLNWINNKTAKIMS